ncbi:hypothetical protein G6F23_015229 [Rhizopus arrhizus]|nr:hypothetical protein G6F23_015229 [Rhizopus arrhizus]
MHQQPPHEVLGRHGGHRRGATQQAARIDAALAQDLDRTAQDARTLHGGHRGPHLLAFGRALHGALDVGLAGDLHFGDHLTGGRVHRLEGLAAGGIDALAVDVQLLDGQGGHGGVLLGRGRVLKRL